MSFSKAQPILKVVTLILLLAGYLLLGVRDLRIDVINPDGINWHTRTQAFTKALSIGDYEKTYQAYHPGITLMWISGPILNLFGVTDYPGDADPKTTFLDRDYYAKLSIVVFCTLLLAASFIVLWKMAGFKYAVFFSIVYSLEPFVIGMRRLYHLDFLMTSLLFLSFLLLLYFSYKTQRWFLIVLSGLFFTLSLLTKSTAIAFLPAVPFIILLGKGTFLKKSSALLLFITSSILFIYVCFPAIWRDPVKAVPEYFSHIAFGVTDIGIEGRKEVGNSGRSDNYTLDDTFNDKAPYFYISSLFMRLSVAGGVLLVVSSGVVIYFLSKEFVLFIWRIIKNIRNKDVSKAIGFSNIDWIAFWSTGFSVAAITALTLSTKKADRYEILAFPFLFTSIAYFFSKTKLYVSLPLVVLYICLTGLELTQWHPYYLAYSNPYLGGIEARLNFLDGSPFGIGSYAAFDVINKDRIATGYDGYFTVAGSKSIKAISAGGRFSRSPSCVTDYIVTYFSDDKPTDRCVQKYKLLDTVKIGGFDYWYVYKRLNQKHQSNYD